MPEILLIVGHSHAQALWGGAVHGGQGGSEGIRLAPVSLRRWPPQGGNPLAELTLRCDSGEPDRAAGEGPQIDDEQDDWDAEWSRHLSTFAARARAAGAAAVLWRASPVDVGLILVGPRFEVALEDASEVSAADVLVPRSAVEDRLCQSLDVDRYRELLQAFVDVLPAYRVAVLASPPPVAGSVARRQILEGAWLRGRVDDLGLGDPSTVPFIDDSVRIKLWRVLLHVHESIAAEFGATFIPPPSESMSADGTLRPELMGGDAQHANLTYGALYLAKIAKWLRSP
jgi:hypothetical protein